MDVECKEILRGESAAMFRRKQMVSVRVCVCVSVWVSDAGSENQIPKKLRRVTSRRRVRQVVTMVTSTPQSQIRSVWSFFSRQGSHSVKQRRRRWKCRGWCWCWCCCQTKASTGEELVGQACEPVERVCGECASASQPCEPCSCPATPSWSQDATWRPSVRS